MVDVFAGIGGTPAVDDADVRVLHGDALETLRTFPAGIAQCIVTSPPFWALRDYGVDGQIGLEATPDEWCARLVSVFREARRVLRDDGVMWLEIGDTYAGGGGGPQGQSGEMVTRSVAVARGDRRRPEHDAGCKAKDLVGAPWMLAFALRADGWYLRSDTIWHRPNPMPESAKDRPTKAHSYVFLLSKRDRYFYDADAIREPATKGSDPEAGRNARSVWTIPTEATPFAHFATFPQALVERCIKAGTSEHGACSACGVPWQRVTSDTLVRAGGGSNGRRRDASEPDGNQRGMVGGPAMSKISETTGWSASCECGAPVRPCVVLDPFMGSGTTALVARRLGRRALGIELSADYIAIARERLSQLSLLSEASA